MFCFHTCSDEMNALFCRISRKQFLACQLTSLSHYEALVSQACSLPCGLQDQAGEGQRLINRLLRTLEIFTKTKPRVSCIFFSRIPDLIIVATFREMTFP